MSEPTKKSDPTIVPQHWTLIECNALVPSDNVDTFVEMFHAILHKLGAKKTGKD